jgi:hypothetical protein
MKRISFGAAVAVAAFLLCGFFLVGQNAGSPSALPVGPNSVNFNAIAILRWYQANQAPTTFPVGSSPYGIAFDGEHMWVANTGSTTVTELQASTGATVGTFTTGAGPYPVALAFDGANIWVANAASSTVTKMQASTGTVLGVFFSWRRAVRNSF